MLKSLRAIWLIGNPAPAETTEFDFTAAGSRTFADHVRIGFLAAVVGALAGGAVILFRLGLQGVKFASFGFQSGSVFDLARELPWWHVLIAPVLGGLLVGVLVRWLSYERRLHGIPDVIIAGLMRQGRLPPRAAIGAAVVSAVSAGAGASVGREGPMVHLGASIGSWAAQRLGVSSYDTQTLLACGVAAGVAASFNVPVGGTIFAFELVAIRYSLQRLAPVVIAAIVGTAVSRAYFGDFPAWHAPPQLIVSYWEFPAFALLGVLSACSAFVLIRSIMTVSHVMTHSPIPPILRPAVGGLAVGAIAVFFPQVLGIGYETTDQALQGALPLTLLFALVLAKILATAFSLGAGFGGGIFTPSIVVGAMTGGTFGVIATAAFPELSSGHTAYTIVGMAAVTGATLGTPFSKIIIIFEMTSSYSLALGVMLAVVIASILLNDVWRTGFFSWQLAQRGVDPKTITPQAMLNDISLESVLRRDVPTITSETGMSEMAAALMKSDAAVVYVLDAEGGLVGQLTDRQFIRATVERSMESVPFRAQAVATHDPPWIEITADAGDAWSSMNEHGTDELPVVEESESMRFIGHVTRRDLLVAYHRALVNST